MSGKRIVIGRKPPARLPEALYGRVRQILESARTSAARSVNTAQVVANWMVGREIVEEEQHGQVRAEYAEGLVAALSERLGGLWSGIFSPESVVHEAVLPGLPRVDRRGYGRAEDSPRSAWRIDGKPTKTPKTGRE